MRKILCMLLCTILLCTQALAMPSVTINNETRLMNISGISEIKNGTVSVTVVKKQNPQSIGAFSDASLFYELETSADGSYGGKFYLPVSAPLSSYYNVYVSGDAEVGEFYRSSPTEIDDCIRDISAASSAQSLEGLLTSYVGVLGVNLGGDYTLYPEWTRKVVFQQIKKTAPSQIGDIIAYFNKGNEAAKLVNGNASMVGKAFEENVLGNSFDASLILCLFRCARFTSRG